MFGRRLGRQVNAVSRSRDKLDIFVIDRGGRAAPEAPVTCVSRSADKLDVFVVGLDGRVWTAAWEPGFSDGWRGWWALRD